MEKDKLIQIPENFSLLLQNSSNDDEHGRCKINSNAKEKANKGVCCAQYFPLNDLPFEILTCILVRVPAEFLVLFKVVCKLWYSLISDQNFVRSHLAHHKKVNLQHPSLVSSTTFIVKLDRSPNGEVLNKHEQLNLHDDDDQDKLSFKNMGFPGLLYQDDMLLESSCDGLLLFRKQEPNGSCMKIYICNPITSQGQTITLSPAELSVEHFFYGSRWTLVYDASIQNYKVIGTLVSRLGQLPTTFVIVFALPYHGEKRVFNLKESANHKGNTETFAANTKPIIANYNKLHWLSKFQGIQEYYLVTMDIVKEEFRRIKGPPSDGKSPILLEMKGTVYLVELMVTLDKLQMWILTDDNNWTKGSCIHLPPQNGGPYNDYWRYAHGYSNPLVMVENNCSYPKLILEIPFPNRFYSYDTRSKKLTRIHMRYVKAEEDRIWEQNCFLHYNVSSLVSVQ